MVSKDQLEKIVEILLEQNGDINDLYDRDRLNMMNNPRVSNLMICNSHLINMVRGLIKKGEEEEARGESPIWIRW